MIARVVCTCTNKFQDQTYGPQVRIANLTQKGGTTEDKRVVRCTVCSKEHTVSKGALK